MSEITRPPMSQADIDKLERKMYPIRIHHKQRTSDKSSQLLRDHVQACHNRRQEEKIARGGI